MFRSTQYSITNQSINLNREHFSVIANLQKQLSSGLRFERSSEAPTESARTQALKEALFNLRSDQAQIPSVTRTLNQGVSSLVEIQNIATRAKQISLDSFQQNDIDGSRSLAAEVDGLLQRLSVLVDSQVDGQYLFSGTRSDVPPVSIEQYQNSPIPLVSYQGANGRASVGISTSVSIDTRYTGSEILFSKDRSESLFFGTTGASAGTGTDNGVGRAFVDVVHTQTIYDGTSGIRPGLSSVEKDTIVGPLGRHTIKLTDVSGDGSFGTISLNGGKEFEFTSADTNLEILGPAGEVIYVDTTAISPGTNAAIEIESNATVSTDGGETAVSIDFSNNQVIRNSQTDQITNIDTSKVDQVGRDHVEYQGSADLITALYELKNDLLNERNLGGTERSESFSRRTKDIDRAAERILETVGEQSVSLQTLEAIDRRQVDVELQLQLGISELQSVDFAAAASELQNRQTLIQANFASLSIVQNLSILNFLG